MTDDDNKNSKKYTIYLPDPPQSSSSPFASLGTQNLISLYGLDRLAQYLARNDAFGQPRKLRKTYKDYLAAIPGRHTIERDDMISRILMNDSGNREPHETVDSATLLECVNLAPGSIPGFDESWIGMDEDEEEDNGNEEDARDESPGTGRRRNGSTEVERQSMRLEQRLLHTAGQQLQQAPMPPRACARNEGNTMARLGILHKTCR